MNMLKEDKHGSYVIVHRYDNGDVIRKYTDHSFREYDGSATWDSIEKKEMKWDQLPIEVQNKGEAYDIVCRDETDPSEPELREYQRNALYDKNGRVVGQLQHWESRFSKFEIWRKTDENDAFDKKQCDLKYMSDIQVQNLKDVWTSKNEKWHEEKKWSHDPKEWHEKWEKRNKRIKLLCENLLNI